MPTCYHCQKEIFFDDNFVSDTGKKIPLSKASGRPHKVQSQAIQQIYKISILAATTTISTGKIGYRAPTTSSPKGLGNKQRRPGANRRKSRGANRRKNAGRNKDRNTGIDKDNSSKSSKNSKDNNKNRSIIPVSTHNRVIVKYLDYHQTYRRYQNRS